MALAQTKTPYEFLARWDDAGVFKGAHISFIDRIMDGETVLSVKVGDAQPVSLAGEQGFPLADVLDAMHASVLADNDAKAAQITTLTVDKTAADQAKTAAESARDAAMAEKQALADQLLEYESPADVNGVPEWVYKSQAYKAMTVSGVFDTFRGALVAAAEQGVQGKLALIDFDTAARFYRNHPTVALMIQSGLLTAVQTDDLWKLAATFAV